MVSPKGLAVPGNRVCVDPGGTCGIDRFADIRRTKTIGAGAELSYLQNPSNELRYT